MRRGVFSAPPPKFDSLPSSKGRVDVREPKAPIVYFNEIKYRSSSMLLIRFITIYPPSIGSLLPALWVVFNGLT